MDTADILFIAADPREFQGAMQYWRNVKPMNLAVHWARSAIWKTRNILAIANGAGPHRAAQAVSAANYQILVNIGFCGAVVPELKIGDIVVGDRYLQPRSSQPFVVGKIASIDRIVQTAAEKRLLRDREFIAVEMEAAGLCDLPFYCIKAVSDLAEESFANNLNDVLQPDGRIDIPKLLFQACLRPFTRVPELKRLQQRAAIASDRLGEFLDSCEF